MVNTTEYTVAMTLVPDEQRLDFWLNHFGAVKGWTTFEVVIFTTMRQFYDDYQGGYWEYCTLSNGGTFIYPGLNNSPSPYSILIMDMKHSSVAKPLALQSVLFSTAFGHLKPKVT